MSPQRVSVPWYSGSVSPYCGAFTTNVFDVTPQRSSVLKYAHNLLVFSCRHFSVSELSAVSVLSFSVPYNIRTMLVSSSQRFSVRRQAHIRLTFLDIGHDNRNGKERRE